MIKYFLFFFFLTLTRAQICQQVQHINDISDLPIKHTPKQCVGFFLIKLKDIQFSLKNVEFAYNVCAEHGDCAYMVFDDDEVLMYKKGCKKVSNYHTYEMQCQHESVDENV